MTHKIGPKGQVVIPKPMRDKLGLKPGMAVDFELSDEKLLVQAHREFESLRGIVPCTGMADRLLEDRAREPR